MDREALAWAGGFFSGEGSTFIHRNVGGRGRLYVRMTITNTSEEALRRFHAAITFGHFWSHPHRIAHYKHVHVWRVNNFEQAQAVLAMLWPFLSAEKRAQAKRVFTTVISDMRIVTPTKRGARGTFVADCCGG